MIQYAASSFEIGLLERTKPAVNQFYARGKQMPGVRCTWGYRPFRRRGSGSGRGWGPVLIRVVVMFRVVMIMAGRTLIVILIMTVIVFMARIPVLKKIEIIPFKWNSVLLLMETQYLWNLAYSMSVFVIIAMCKHGKHQNDDGFEDSIHIEILVIQLSVSYFFMSNHTPQSHWWWCSW